MDSDSSAAETRRGRKRLRQEEKWQRKLRKTKGDRMLPIKARKFLQKRNQLLYPAVALIVASRRLAKSIEPEKP